MFIDKSNSSETDIVMGKHLEYSCGKLDKRSFTRARTPIDVALKDRNNWLKEEESHDFNSSHDHVSHECDLTSIFSTPRLGLRCSRFLALVFAFSLYLPDLPEIPTSAMAGTNYIMLATSLSNLIVTDPLYLLAFATTT